MFYADPITNVYDNFWVSSLKRCGDALSPCGRFGKLVEMVAEEDYLTEVMLNDDDE